MKTVLLESYMKKNLGDDLFVRIISERYEDAKFFVKTFRLYRNSKNVCYRYDFLGKCSELFFKRKYYGKRKYDARVILGGSVFIEQNETNSVVHDRLLRKYFNNKCPLFVIGANFGPYRNDYYYEEHFKLFSKATDVCFRDNYSQRLFKSLKNVRVAPDVIYGINVSKYRNITKKRVVISTIDLEGRRDLSKYREKYEKTIVDMAIEYERRGYEVLLMSFCKAEGDEKVAKRIKKAIGPGRRVKTYKYRGNIDEALRLIAEAEIIVGTRFHSIVLGIAFGKTIVPFVYSEKTSNMLTDIGYSGRVVRIAEINDSGEEIINGCQFRMPNIEGIKKESYRQFEKLDKILKRKA